MKNKNIKRRSIGTLVVLLFVLSFSITPALMFTDLNFGPGSKKFTDEEFLNLSTNYLFKGTTYTFNLDDFYDDEDLYKVYTGAKFQTEAFDGEALEWSGVINNDTVTPVDNDETQYGTPSGVFNGTYDFRDEVDEVGLDIDFVDDYSTSDDCYAKVIEEKLGHKKVLEIFDDNNAGYVSLRHNHDIIQINGTYEFWWAYDGTLSYQHYLYFRVYEGGSERIRILFGYQAIGQIVCHDGTDYHTLALGLPVNTWYHIKIVFDDSANTFDFYIDGEDKGTFDYFSNSTVGLNIIRMSTRDTGDNYAHWIDAISFKSGVYLATYGFEDDIGKTGTDISWVRTNQMTDACEIVDYLGHNSVLHFKDVTDSGSLNSVYFDSEITSGVVEAWINNPYANDWYFRMFENGGGGVSLVSLRYTSKTNIAVYHGDGGGGMDTHNVAVIADAWIHIKVSFDCTTDTHSVWIDGVNIFTDENFGNDQTVTNIYWMNIYSADFCEGYVDAIGYSWDPDYNVGDNLEGYDPDYTIGENLYPDNINMIEGSYDYTDNMKVNDDSSTNFTSTPHGEYEQESPSQWDDFTFTEGTGNTIGELETNNDANYAIIDSGEDSGESVFDTIHPDGDVIGLWTLGDALPHWSKIDEAPEDDNGDGGNIVGYGVFLSQTTRERQDYEDVDLGSETCTRIRIHIYAREVLGSDARIVVTTSLGGYVWFDPPNPPDPYFYFSLTSSYTWYSDDFTGSWSDAQIDALRVNMDANVDVPSGSGRADVEAIYVEVFTYQSAYKCDYEMTWNVTDPDLIDGTINYFSYDYQTNESIDCDLDIYNWDISDWLELESNTDVNWHTDSYILTDPYINDSNYVKIRFQTAIFSSDFHMNLDQIALDYLTIPAELEMTITFPFSNYNEDLLAMNVQSWQKTNISQTITFKIWNYNTETWVQISSSSDTSFTKKEYNTESPANFISSNGIVKLYWGGSDTLNDFELHIDYLFIQIYYKLDLVHSKSFDTNGIYRYRWVVLGSIYYTQWVTFEVVDPVPNFHAISESDLTTRWVLQGADISAVQNFTDDISGSNWNLYGVSEDSFYAHLSESYLFDNTTASGIDDWAYSGFSFPADDSVPNGICWDGSHLWVVGSSTDEVYKYNTAGVYQGVSWDVGGQTTIARGITWDGTFFWVVGYVNQEVYKYNAAGVYQTFSFSVSVQDTKPTDITWDGTHLWVIGNLNDRVYKYNTAGVYQAVSFDVSGQVLGPKGINWDGTHFWVVNDIGDEVYQYNAAGAYTGYHFDVGAQNTLPTAITWDGTHLWVVGDVYETVFQYETVLDVSKKYQGGGYMYIQTNTTELISLKSTAYGSNYTLSSGDYFEIDFQTSSDSLINLILLKDGVVNKTLTLSQSGNPNFNRHTVQISVGEDVEFDMLRTSSTFEDIDYVRIYDIKTYKYTITGDYADFMVGSKNDYETYLTPDEYNLRIWDPYDGEVKVNKDITISSGYNYEIYEPTESIQCRLVLFSEADPLKSLTFTDYHIEVNRSLNGEYNKFSLLENLFYADDNSSIHIFIDVYDRFNALIDSFDKLPSSYIDLELEVYSLEIINLMTQKTTMDINGSHIFDIASGRWINFMLSKRYYQIGYFNPNNVYIQFIIKLDSNQVYELNMSRICNLYYTNQRMESLSFYQFKTYINGTRIINNMFYATDGEHKGIEVKDLSDISVLNYTYVEGTQEYNQVSLILTQYSLKVMSLQLNFNHINITRNPDYYTSSYYWSEWLGPRETAEYFLFPGYYVINITNYEDGGWSKYDYTLNGDDYILIGSNNTIYNVLVNIANVNATIGNQITNVQIDLTNQNSNINNTIINIEINLGNINSTLGSFLVNIDTAISNINSSIISEIVSLGVNIDNVNSSLSNQMLTINTDISNLDSSI